MDRELDVGIVGCGFAGLASALFVARAGHRVTLYERVPEPSSVGAGILLQPTGLAVLSQLGIKIGLLARGARIDALRCETVGGKQLFDLRYADLERDLFGVGTHRGLLFELLYDAARTSSLEVRSGVEVMRVASTKERATLFDERGAIAEHDLVVVADGARSKLRALSSRVTRARAYRWGALWFVGADPEHRFDGALSQVCDGTRRMLGFLPTGLGPGRATTPLVSLFYSLRMDRLDAWRRAGLARWKSEVAHLSPDAAPLLEQIEDIDQVLTAGYVDVVMRRWHDGRVVYVGDAAHAMSPQLGQGTNLALLDAATLGACLSEPRDVESALVDYGRRRRAHVRFYQFASRWLTPFFQSDQSMLATLRDFGFPLAVRIGPLKKLMLSTLSGVKRGLVRVNLRLAP